MFIVIIFHCNFMFLCLQISFGESQSSDSEELLNAISTFIAQFKKAVKEIQQGNRHNKGIKLEGLK